MAPVGAVTESTDGATVEASAGVAGAGAVAADQRMAGEREQL